MFPFPLGGWLLLLLACCSPSQTPSPIYCRGYGGVLSGGVPAMHPRTSRTRAPVLIFVLIGHLMSWPFGTCSPSSHLNHW